jgi:tRNA A-37 threonylcarbamoyl transferase component Bud32
MIKFEIAKGYEGLKESILDIQAIFEDNNNSIHKARNEIKIIEIDGKKLVVKAFKIPHIVNKIAYSFFRASKAKRSYENSLKIEEFVPPAIAYIEFFENNLLEKSYFISQNYDYDFTIREPISDKEFPNRDYIFKSFAEFTYHLHQKDILHKDYSPGNILIKKQNLGYEFKIIDINRMEFKKLTLDERLQNFSRLSIEDRDLTIIIKEYAKLISKDSDDLVQRALKYLHQHTKSHSRKKELKNKLRKKA